MSARFTAPRHPASTGERTILDMFEAPPVDRRRTAAVRLAQHGAAQALMKMGVRVKPGKWPVEAV